MSYVLLLATPDAVLRFDESGGRLPAAGLEGERPTALAADPMVPGRAWCCTRAGGVFRSDNRGESWRSAGLRGERLMSIMPSPARKGLVWAGSEPSTVFRSDDDGANWQPTADLGELPSSGDWAFPPRPETHHVRWITCDPADAERIWVAVEAGALIRTEDGGRTWIDRVPDGPYDTHELAIHPAAPRVLRSAAGDGYFESRDGGRSWASPMEGMDVGYLRSVAIDPGDPEVVLVSASSGPRSAYVAGRSDGRVYRREGEGPWRRVDRGWPDQPSTIAPLLIPGDGPGHFLAADERGIHESRDGGLQWVPVETLSSTPDHLRALARVG